jgi:RNA polymerase sigma-70 factor (ECF subfamily)
MPFEADSPLRPPTAITESRSDQAAVFANELAFSAWYERSLPRVYAYLFHRCGRNPEVAEELTQQAFVEAVRSRRRFRGQSDPTTWVIGIARHRLLDQLRRNERDARRLGALAAQELDRANVPVPSSPAEGPDDIDDALAVLPPLQRAVLILHYMDRLSVRDVARAIKKSETATASLLARGRDAFRQAYQEGNR